jgi:tetratricopeptide (TPR) repeat protein
MKAPRSRRRTAAIRVLGSAAILMPMAIPAAGAAAAAGAKSAVEVYARGDYAGAVKLLAPLHAAGKANIQQRLILARACLHLGKDARSLSVLRSVLDTDKENPEANSLTGQLLLKAGKHKEALEPLEHAWRLKSDPATAAALGRCYHALGQPAKAKVHLEWALKRDIRDPASSFLLGRICLDRGLGALAQRYLLMAQEAGMDSLDLHLLLGRAYLLQRKLVGPVMVRRISKPVRPGDVVAGRLVLGRAAGAAGTHKVGTRYSALYEGLEVLKRSARHRDGLFMAAAGWLAADQAELAGKALRRLRAVEPNSRRALALQAELALATQDFGALGKCLAAAKAAKALEPQQIAEYYFRWALALRAEGKHQAAVAALEKAEKRTPTAPNVLRALATLCVAIGRKAQARQYYARMVELFPDAADIDELRNALEALQEPTGERK